MGALDKLVLDRLLKNRAARAAKKAGLKPGAAMVTPLHVLPDSPGKPATRSGDEAVTLGGPLGGVPGNVGASRASGDSRARNFRQEQQRLEQIARDTIEKSQGAESTARRAGAVRTIANRSVETAEMHGDVASVKEAHKAARSAERLQRRADKAVDRSLEPLRQATPEVDKDLAGPGGVRETSRGWETARRIAALTKRRILGALSLGKGSQATQKVATFDPVAGKDRVVTHRGDLLQGLPEDALKRRLIALRKARERGGSKGPIADEAAVEEGLVAGDPNAPVHLSDIAIGWDKIVRSAARKAARIGEDGVTELPDVSLLASDLTSAWGFHTRTAIGRRIKFTDTPAQREALRLLEERYIGPDAELELRPEHVERELPDPTDDILRLPKTAPDRPAGLVAGPPGLLSTARRMGPSGDSELPAVSVHRINQVTEQILLSELARMRSEAQNVVNTRVAGGARAGTDASWTQGNPEGQPKGYQGPALADGGGQAGAALRAEQGSGGDVASPANQTYQGSLLSGLADDPSKTFVQQRIASQMEEVPGAHAPRHLLERPAPATLLPLRRDDAKELLEADSRPWPRTDVEYDARTGAKPPVASGVARADKGTKRMRGLLRGVRQSDMPGGMPRLPGAIPRRPGPGEQILTPLAGRRGPDGLRKVIDAATGKPVLASTGRARPVFGTVEAINPDLDAEFLALKSQLQYVTDPTVRKKLESRISALVGKESAEDTRSFRQRALGSVSDAIRYLLTGKTAEPAFSIPKPERKRAYRFVDASGRESGRPLVLEMMGEGSKKRTAAERRYFRNVGPAEADGPDRYVEIDEAGAPAGMSLGKDGGVRAIAERDVAHLIDKGYRVGQAPQDLQRQLRAPQKLGLQDPGYVASWLSDFLDTRSGATGGNVRQAKWALSQLKGMSALQDQEPFRQAIMALGAESLRRQGKAGADVAFGKNRAMAVLEGGDAPPAVGGRRGRASPKSTAVRQTRVVDTSTPAVSADEAAWNEGLALFRKLDEELPGMPETPVPAPSTAPSPRPAHSALVDEQVGRYARMAELEDAVSKAIKGEKLTSMDWGAFPAARQSADVDYGPEVQDLMAGVYRELTDAGMGSRQAREAVAALGADASELQQRMYQLRASDPKTYQNIEKIFSGRGLGSPSERAELITPTLNYLRGKDGVSAAHALEMDNLASEFKDVQVPGVRAGQTPGQRMLEELDYAHENLKNAVEGSQPSLEEPHKLPSLDLEAARDEFRRLKAYSEAAAILKHERAARDARPIKSMSDWHSAVTRGMRPTDESILAAISQAIDLRRASQGGSLGPGSARQLENAAEILDAYPDEAASMAGVLDRGNDFLMTDAGRRAMRDAGYVPGAERQRIFERSGLSDDDMRLKELEESPRLRKEAMERIVANWRNATSLADEETLAQGMGRKPAAAARFPRLVNTGAPVDVAENLAQQPWTKYEQTLERLHRLSVAKRSGEAKQRVGQEEGFSPILTDDELFALHRTPALTNEGLDRLDELTSLRGTALRGGGQFIPHSLVADAAEKVAREMGVTPPLAFKRALEKRTRQEREISKSQIESIRKGTSEAAAAGQSRIGEWLDQSPENRRFLETGQGQAWLDSAAGQEWLSRNQAVDTEWMKLPAFRPQARWLETPGGRRWLQTEAGKRFAASGQPPVRRLEGAAARKLEAQASAVASRGRNFAQRDTNKALRSIIREAAGSTRSARDAYDNLLAQIATGRTHGPSGEGDLARQAAGTYDEGVSADDIAPGRPRTATDRWGSVEAIDARIYHLMSPRGRGPLGSVDTDPAVFLDRLSRALSQKLGRAVTPQEVVASGIFGKSMRLRPDEAKYIADLAVERVGTPQTPGQLAAGGTQRSLKAGAVELPPHPLDRAHALVEDARRQISGEPGTLVANEWPPQVAAGPNQSLEPKTPMTRERAAQLLQDIDDQIDRLKGLRAIHAGTPSEDVIDRAQPGIVRRRLGAKELERPVTPQEIQDAIEALSGVRRDLVPLSTQLDDLQSPDYTQPADAIASDRRARAEAERVKREAQIAAAAARPEPEDLPRHTMQPLSERLASLPGRGELTIALTPEEARRLMQTASGDVLDARGLTSEQGGAFGDRLLESPEVRQISAAGDLAPPVVSHTIPDTEASSVGPGQSPSKVFAQAFNSSRRVGLRPINFSVSRQYGSAAGGRGIEPTYTGSGLIVNPENNLIPHTHTVLAQYDPASRQFMSFHEVPAVGSYDASGKFVPSSTLRHGSEIAGGRARVYDWFDDGDEKGRHLGPSVGFAPNPSFTRYVELVGPSRSNPGGIDFEPGDALRTQISGQDLREPVLGVFTPPGSPVPMAARGAEDALGTPLSGGNVDTTPGVEVPVRPAPPPPPSADVPPVDAGAAAGAVDPNAPEMSEFARQVARKEKIAATLRRAFGRSGGAAGAMVLGGLAGGEGLEDPEGDTNLLSAPRAAAVLNRVRAMRMSAPGARSPAMASSPLQY